MKLLSSQSNGILSDAKTIWAFAEQLKNLELEHQRFDRFSEELDRQICEKSYRNHPLTEEQKESNRLKSKGRCRIEHIFGTQKMRMGNEILRSIGFARARFWIGMRNLMYNMSRLVSLKRPKPVKAKMKVEAKVLKIG